LQKYSTICALRQNFAARHIENALHLTLLNKLLLLKGNLSGLYKMGVKNKLLPVTIPYHSCTNIRKLTIGPQISENWPRTIRATVPQLTLPMQL
jgi:hypothetical protein